MDYQKQNLILALQLNIITRYQFMVAWLRVCNPSEATEEFIAEFYQEAS